MKQSPRITSIFVLVIAASVSTRAQYADHNVRSGAQSSAALPTPSSFAYPQSVFIDSPNGHIWISDFSNHRVLRFDVSSLTLVHASTQTSSPLTFALKQNYPNPFNPATQISFSTRSTEVVVLTVHNVLGQEVATLFKDVATAGTVYTLWFDGKKLPSGMYVYSLRSASGFETRKMSLLK